MRANPALPVEISGGDVTRQAANPLIRTALNAAITAHKAGELDTAEARYRKILKGAPQEFDALTLLGTLLCQRKAFHKGLEYLRMALRIRPQSLNLLLNTGLCLQELERNNEALEVFEKGLSLSTNAAVFLRGKATALHKLQKFAEALECFKSIEGNGANTDADDINHGLILYELGKFDESLVKLTRASGADPANPTLLYNTGRCLLKLGELEQAISAFDSALEISPNDSKAQMARAETARAMNDSDSALRSIERVLALESENSLAQGFKATLLLDLGRQTEAAEIFRGLAKRKQQIGEALFGLSQCKTYSVGDADGDLILNGRAIPQLDAENLSLAQFAASKLYDDCGMYDEAFLAATEARKLKPPLQKNDYNLEAIGQAFNRPFFESFSFAGNTSGQPVFVVGMPRSGTSLVEQIIASHPDAYGVGELEDLLRIGKGLGAMDNDPASITRKVSSWNDEALEQAAANYLRALLRDSSGATRVVDKMPHNFMLIGIISILFPRAKIVHVRRNAADTCLSIYLNNLKGTHGYANDLTALGKHYRSYDLLMRHWHDLLGSRIYLCDYEKLVETPEQEIRQLLSYLELPWDERCLRFFETKRTVTTFSRGQVRKPIYGRSVGRWRNYEKHLAPLLKELGSLHPVD